MVKVSTDVVGKILDLSAGGFTFVHVGRSGERHVDSDPLYYDRAGDLIDPIQ